MVQPQTFAEILATFIENDGRHVRQLSQAIADEFGTEQLVPNNTISRWLRGEVKKPRNWSDIVKLCAVLHLSEGSMFGLLLAAGHDGSILLASDSPVPGLFDYWQEAPPDRLPPFQAPPELPAFIGRENVVATLSRYLCSRAQRRVCCLLGMAGLGKTSLAVHLAYQLRDEFADGVLWVSLDQADPMVALAGIADAYQVDVSVYTDLSSRSSKVRELLAEKNALLVLDNAESDHELRPLLPPDGDCAVLITSRRRDLVVTDHAYRLNLNPFDRDLNESLDLFRHVLGTQVIEDETALFQKIADRVGQLPLAINIIAQRLRHEPGWTAASLFSRLREAEQRLNLLARGDQQVRLSFALSFEMLETKEQQLFALLGLFPGSFSGERAAEVAQRPLWDVEDSLRQFYNLSLVQSTTGSRWQLHPLLRDFSREQPQDESWAVRFVQAFVALAEDEAALIDDCHNVIAAIQGAHTLGMVHEEITAVIAVYPFLQRQGRLNQASELLSVAEQTARKTNHLDSLVIILNQTGYTAMKKGHPNQAESYYQEALTLAQQLENSEQTADILLKLGALAYRRGRLEEAQQFFAEGLDLARQQQHQRLIASLLTNLGLVEAARGGLVNAIDRYEEALSISRAIQDAGLTINILQNLGNMQEERGDYAQAHAHYEEGLALADAQNDPELRSRMLGNLGTVACHLRNYAEATAFFRRGLTLAEANDLSIQIYRQQANLGHVFMLRGKHHQANTHYQESISLARELGFPEDLGMILNQAGENAFDQDNFKEAETYFSEALQIAESGQLQRVAPLSLFGLARVAAVRGNIAEARRLGARSRKQLVAIGHNKANEVWWWLQELPGEGLPDKGLPEEGQPNSLNKVL